MFTCAKIRNGSTYLGSHLTANDYYCENEKIIGRWVGLASGLMGIEGNAIGKNDADFEALRRNLFPGTSEPLTPLRKKDGVRFFDFQCSAQKSVSIMAVTMGDKRLYKAHDKAAARAFVELERFAAFRAGASREPEITGNICAAAFRHDASRALDPQIHTHFVVANATWDSISGRWLSLDTCEMFRAIRYAGKTYQNELAIECRRLGYKVESIRNDKGIVEGFEIAGVSKDIRERFSKRRAEVEAGIERFQSQKGRMPTAQEIQVITRDTRNVKLHEITTPEVRARQMEQLSEEEKISLEAVKRQANGNEPAAMGSAWKALTRAVEHIYERKSVVKGHEVMAEALNRNLGFINLETLRRYMKSAYNGMIRLTENVKNPTLSSQWASVRGLRLEQWAIEFVNQSQNCCNPLGKTNVDFDFKSDEQRSAVLETLNNRDRVYAIRGCAGAGKTTCLSEIRKGLEAAGRTAIYLAPTSSAVEVLQKDGFTAAATVDSFLTNEKRDLTGVVVIIDESSLQSNEMGHAVLTRAFRARVLFIGDTRQHVSVEAGDFLRVLERHSNLNYSELKDIRRQEQKEYNAVVRALSQGDVIGGMKQLDGLGWINEGRKDYIEQAADAYIDCTENGADLNRCIAISPTWDELHRFTDAIRQRMKERRLLADKGVSLTVCHQLDWTLEQRKTAGNYRPGMLVTFNAGRNSVLSGRTLEVEKIESGNLRLRGHGTPINAARYAHKFSVSLPRVIEISEGDRILIRRNRRETRLINGKVLTVNRINHDGSIETRDKDGKKFIVPSGYRHFTHGYAITSYKSQGRTHQYAVVASEKLDAKTAYVALSRGRKEARVFTPDKHSLFDNLGKPSDRTAATDVIGDIRPVFWRKNEYQAYQYSVKDHFAFQNFNMTNNHSNDFRL